MISRFDTIGLHDCDERTDGQTDTARRHRPCLCIASCEPESQLSLRNRAMIRVICRFSQLDCLRRLTLHCRIIVVLCATKFQTETVGSKNSLNLNRGSQRIVFSAGRHCSTLQLLSQTCKFGIERVFIIKTRRHTSVQ